MTFLNFSITAQDTLLGTWLEYLFFTLTGQNPDPIGSVASILITLYLLWYAATYLAYAGALIVALVHLILRSIKLIKRKLAKEYVWLYIVIACTLLTWGVWSGVLSSQILAKYDHVMEFVGIFMFTPLYSTLCLLPCFLFCANAAIAPAARAEQDAGNSAINVPACIGMGAYMLLMICELLFITIAPFPVKIERFVVLIGNYGVFGIQLAIFLVGGLINLIKKRRRKVPKTDE